MAPAMSDPVPQGYILQNRVTHFRGLPISSTHAFRYHTLSFLLGVDALESGQLDLAAGFVFGYGRRWGRLLGLRSQPYLNTLSSSSIRQKLEDQLRKHHRLRNDETFQDAWIMTMPSILGFEGINPLTVYFCYQNQALWIVVLEIHNTFGESHVHLLEVGTNEDTTIARGYDHQWTFRRQFHVSPFNDRSGFYTVSVKSPGMAPRSYKADMNAGGSILLPVVSVRLYTDPETTTSLSPEGSSLMCGNDDQAPAEMHGRPSLGKLKLAAYLRTTSILPLTTKNVMQQLMKQPFVLFLTMPRILYHAWVLHFSKRLDVFPRPEPHPVITRSESPSTDEAVPGGGVGWQDESVLESYARRVIIEFLHRRTAETGVSVVLRPSNPSIAPTKILTAGKTDDASTLEISYLTPRLFTTLFSCPSGAHSLLLGSDAEKFFQVSSKHLFTTIFSYATRPQAKASFLQGTLQSLRRARVPDGLDITSPVTHFLDIHRSTPSLVLSTIVLCSIALLDYLERTIFRATGARFVVGTEPWNAWQRAVLLHTNRKDGKVGGPGSPSIVYGSARRDG
ncbi:hypothetical protein D9756_008075 [Leucocoprinus leucothites]|uniref:Uncharacterized protein n=1 Tax=Leucocoprinus leucothites TaxID=201217 RepID=A0A8H5D6P2_9AGAR|nr:hypothetical protein D9756_008075 [Leucoagaricus leucothites]